MKVSILATTLFAASALARIHTWCTCQVNGKDNVDLAHNTCTQWGTTEPNTQWDASKSCCADFHKHGGIDGDPWEKTCQNEWKFAYGGNPSEVRGRCFS